MYNLIKYSSNYSKTSENLWKYYIDESFNRLQDSESLKYKSNIAEKTPDDGNTKNIKIVAPLKHLSNFWRTLEMPLINCEINPILTSSEKCFISSATGERKFAITDTKLYVPIVNSSTQGNVKLLQQLKSGFKRTINWNKYQSKVTIQEPNTHLDYLIDPSFQGVNRLFVLWFEILQIKQCTQDIIIQK